MLVTQQQMSAATLAASESTTSHDVNELRRQLDRHDVLMRDLTSYDAQLEAAMSQAQALDTNIAGKHFVRFIYVFDPNILGTVAGDLA